MRRAARSAGLLATIGFALSVAGPVASQEMDRGQIVKDLQDAWHDRFRCLFEDSCSSYFDSLGVALVFSDGSTAAFDHEQRGETSGHNCIKLAKSFLAKGDRGRAVQWAIASQRSGNVREWMREHPDQVLELLRGCCS